MAFHNPVPPPPFVGGSYDASADRRHQDSSRELQARLRMLDLLLEPYIETYFDTADGQRLAALARPFGPAAATGGPFSLISLSSSGELILSPGTVNQLLINDPFSALSCSGSLTYIKIHCTTSSYQVNDATLEASSTPATPAPALKGAPPLEFDVTIGIVASDGTSFTYYPTWPKGFNVIAKPQVWLATDRDSPDPGQTFQETWYSWDIAAAYDPL